LENNNLELISFFNKNKIENDIFELRPEILNCPRTPIPLHGQVPREILGRKWWDETRKKSYLEAGFMCQACGIPKDSEFILWKNQLHAHEVYDIDYKECRIELKEVVALCESCHYFIHDGRTSSLFDHGIYTEEECFLIFNRGLQVLGHEKNRNELDNEEYYIKTWGKWHLFLNGKKYYSKYKNIDEWAKFYNIKKEE